MTTMPNRTPGERAQAQLEALVAARHAPGISMLVVGADGVRFEGHAGVMDAAGDVPVGSGTMYMGCSTTKFVTALVVLQLVACGEMELDAPVSRYLEHPYGDGVTVRGLLAHTSGVPNPAPLDWFFVEGEPLESEAAYRAVLRRASRLAAEPGARYVYSNIGYWMLGRAIERVLGSTYAAAVRAGVFEPLGIDDASVSFVLPPKERLATGHARKWSLMTAVFYLMTPRKYWADPAGGWSRYHRVVHHGAAYGGLYTTVGAFGAVLQDLLRPDSRLLKAASKAALFQTQPGAEGGTLGCVAGDVGGVGYYGKQGGGLGFHGNVRLYPEAGLGTVYFANATRVAPGPIDAVSDRLDHPFVVASGQM